LGSIEDDGIDILNY
jgi:hAT family C-terminal dimerisation region